MRGTRRWKAKMAWAIGAALAAVMAILALTRSWRHGPVTPQTDLGIGMRLAVIEPGSFSMGCEAEQWCRESDEVPARLVRIARRFAIGACEVTQGQWQCVMGGNPARFRGPSLPVERVSYQDAVEFCLKLSSRSGHTVRLPTEEEWEYACRAGTSGLFATGDILTAAQARFSGELGPDPAAPPTGPRPVGSFPPNAWGLHDMHGNVWEWCRDTYVAPSASARYDPEPPPPELRVVRGGGWISGPIDCRSASREGFPSDSRCDFVGFRVMVEMD